MNKIFLKQKVESPIVQNIKYLFQVREEAYRPNFQIERRFSSIWECSSEP